MSQNVTLLTAIVEDRTEPGTVKFMANGEDYMKAIVNAVAFHYYDLSGRPEPDEEKFRAMAENRAKVTLLQTGESMLGAPMLIATPGTLAISRSTGSIGILPKGSRKNGYRVNMEKLIDFEPGYNGVETLRERVNRVRAFFPQTRPLTRERLNQLPAEGDDCTLSVLGTLRLPDGETPGAVWLIHSFMREEDIVEGVLIVPDGFAVSEHGSILGAELMRMGGEILNAPTISLKEALDFTNKSWRLALDRLNSKTHSQSKSIAAASALPLAGRPRRL